MGQQASVWWRGQQPQEPGGLKLLVLGLDWAGKSSLVHRLMAGDSWDSMAAACTRFSIDTVKLDGAPHLRQEQRRLVLWDVAGGRDKRRALLRDYFPGAQGLLFVVDCADRKRLPLAARELQLLLAEPDLAGLPLAVACNKHDHTAGAGGGGDAVATVEEVQRLLLGVDGVDAGRSRFFETSAITGRGVRDVFEWLAVASSGGRGGGDDHGGGWAACLKGPARVAMQALTR